MSERHLVEIEVVGERTHEVPPDEGFLRLRRFLVRNRYDDDSVSDTYHCDLVSRRQPDAVAVVVYGEDENRRLLVALRTGVRPPIYLRKAKQEDLVVPDERFHLWTLDLGSGRTRQLTDGQTHDEQGR